MVNILAYEKPDGTTALINQQEIADQAKKAGQKGNEWLAESLGFQSVDEFLAVNNKNLGNVAGIQESVAAN